MQRQLNNALSQKPIVHPNKVENLERQKHIDVLSLYQKKDSKVQARTDRDERIAYIRECKKKLGLNDGLLLKSSKR